MSIESLPDAELADMVEDAGGNLDRADQDLLREAARRLRRRPLSNEPPFYVIDRRPSKVFMRLVEIAETPGEWGLVTVLSTEHSARTTCYTFRDGRRRLPEGVWEFRYGPLPASNEYGIWGRLTPPQTGGKDESAANAGRVNRARSAS